MIKAVVFTPIKYKNKTHIFIRDYADWVNTKHINWTIRWESATNKPGSMQGSKRLQPSNYYHRYILNLKRGDKRQVDHINRNPLDNRRCNLRICNHKQNGKNRTLGRDNITGYKGIQYKRKKYEAYITTNALRIYLGSYQSKEEAATAYMFGSLLYHGEFGAAF